LYVLVSSEDELTEEFHATASPNHESASDTGDWDPNRIIH